jgi:hypothetical protein
MFEPRSLSAATPRRKHKLNTHRGKAAVHYDFRAGNEAALPAPDASSSAAPTSSCDFAKTFYRRPVHDLCDAFGVQLARDGIVAADEPSTSPTGASMSASFSGPRAVMISQPVCLANRDVRRVCPEKKSS